MIANHRFSTALIFLLSGPLVFPQEVEIRPLLARSTAAAEADRATVIKVDSNLVLIPVHVTNRAGASVNGLGPDAFSVFEDKVPRPIAAFGNDDAPCSIGVIFDLSGSMTARLKVASDVLRVFLDEANPDDEAFLLTVSTRPRTLHDFTNDFGVLESDLVGAQAGGATALIDTVFAGIDKMRHAHYARKALLIVSDGVDNHSRYTAHELIRVVDEADVQIYTMGVDTWAITKKPVELTEDRNGQAFLRTLSNHSGGMNLELRGYEDIAAAAAKVSRAIRDQYLIGYRPPTNDNTGKWRTIRVKVNKPHMQVSSRTGYYLR